jgi:tetratricopeptide (TPR) repeat protein
MRVSFRPRILQYLLITVSILDVFPILIPHRAWALDKETPAIKVAQPPAAAAKKKSAASPTAPLTDEDRQLNDLFAQGQFQTIVDQLTPQLDKLDGRKMKLLGRAHSELKNTLLALKTFSLALNKNPKDAEAKMLIGREDFLRHKDPEAMVSLREALELDPNLEETYLVIEQIYIKKNNKYELRMLYSDMVQQMGEKPKYIARLCELNTLSGIYDLANTYCTKGMKLQPDEPKNYIYRAMTLKETGSLEEAKSLYKATADKYKSSDEAQIGYAQFLDEQKNYLESSKYYKDATIANPKSMKGLIGLALSSTEIQQYQQALDALVIACNLNRQSITQVRKVMGILRVLKETKWYEKFEALSETCGLPAKKD